MIRKIILQLYLILASIPFTFSQSGTLVPSFGDYGLKHIDFGNIGWSNDFGEVIKTDPDGKILIAGGYSGVHDEPFIIRLNPDGSLDSTFGMEGKKILQFENTGDRIYGLALTVDRKIILIGRSNWDFSIRQLNHDGSLDSTFGENGSVVVPAQSEFYDEGSLGYAIDPEKKIYVAGGSKNGFENQEDFTIVRMNPDGNLDNTFGTSGKLLVHIDTANCSPISACIPKVRSMALDYNNKLLVAGTFLRKATAIRMDNMGNPDSTFGNEGRISIGDLNVKRIAVDKNGKIVISGDGPDEPNKMKIIVVRLNDNGSFDSTFGSFGIKSIFIGDNDFDFSYDMVLDNNDKIIIAGTSYSDSDQDFSIVRLNANGTEDSTFNNDGKLMIPVGIGGDAARSLTLDPNGKLLIAGSSYNGKNFDFSVARLNEDGNLDNTFDEDGKLLIHSNGIDEARSMVIDSDGKVLAAGFSYTGSDNDFSIVRLNTDGSLDKTFNHSGKLTMPVGNGDDVADCIVLDANNKILLIGSSEYDNQRIFSIVRLNYDGRLDTTFNSNGKLLNTVCYECSGGATGLAIDASGKLVLVGRSWVLRLNPDGNKDISFDEDGEKIMDNPLNVTGTCVAIDGNGKILMAGTSYVEVGRGDHYNGFQIIRLNTNGNFDSTFDGDGILMLDYDNPKLKYYINSTSSINFDPSGKIIVSGTTSRNSNVWNNRNTGFGITRLNSDGSLDTTFIVNGKPLTPTKNDIRVNSTGLTFYGDGGMLIAGSIEGAFVVLRLNSDGSPDSTFGDNGLKQPTDGLCYSMKADSNYIWMAGSDEFDFKIVKLFARNNQHIDFSLPDTVLLDDAPVKLAGTASSGLQVTYTSSNTSIANISLDTLIINGPGSVTITARQDGNGSYYAADPLSRNLVVRSNGTGIPAIDQGKEISAYPNPASGILSIDGRDKIKSVVIRGIEGSLLYEDSNINEYHYRLNVSGYKPGCYILTIQLDDKHPAQVRKIIKY